MRNGFTESKMKFARVALLVVCGLLSSFPSYASRNAKFREGNSSGGGGDAIVCKKGKLKKVFLADTFELITEGKVASLSDYREEVYKEALLRTIEALDHDLGSVVRARLREIKFRHNDEGIGFLLDLFPGLFRIGELDNDYLEISELGCKKQQLARQKIEKKKVIDEFSLFVGLTPFERGVYPVHESLISVRHAERDTTSVRHEIAAFVSSPEYERQLSAVALEIQELSKEEKLRWLTTSIHSTWKGKRHFVFWGGVKGSSFFVPDFHPYQASTDRIYIRVSDFKDAIEELGINGEARFISKSTAQKIAEKLVDRVAFPPLRMSWI